MMFCHTAAHHFLLLLLAIQIRWHPGVCKLPSSTTASSREQQMESINLQTAKSNGIVLENRFSQTVDNSTDPGTAILQTSISRETFFRKQTASTSANGLVSPETDSASVLNKSQELPLCNLTVTDYSRNFFHHYIFATSLDFVRFKLNFSKNIKKSYDPDLIMEDEWVWTPHFGVLHYLNWPYDFPIVSLNLLQPKTRTSIYLRFNSIDEKECQVHLGRNSTTNAIAEAVRKVTKYMVDTVSNSTKYFTKYAFISWCFIVVRKGFNNTTAYKAGKYLGLHVTIGKYSCCSTSYNWDKHDITISCDKTVLDSLQESDIWPELVSAIVLLYSPLFLIYIYPGKVQKAQGTDFQPSESQEEERPLVSVLRDNDGVGLLVGENKDKFIYLDGEPPVKPSKMLLDICGLGRNHPNTASRIRRFMFLLLSPTIICVNIMLHYLLEKDFTDAILAHNSPMAFITVLGKEFGKQLFVPYFGGPLGVFALYYLLGFIFLVLPQNLNQVLTVTVKPDPSRELSPLLLRVTTIQALSSIPFIDTDNKVSFCPRLQARFMVLWRPKFWYFVLYLQRQRFMRIFTTGIFIESRCVGVVLMAAVMPLYLVFCIAELILCIVYYGFPFIGFIILGSNAVYQYLAKKLKLRCTPLDILFLVLMVTTLSAFFFTFILVFTHSFEFIARILFFTYMAVIISPSNAFGYVFFGSAILFYLYKLVTRIGQEYNELLVHVVHICRKLESKACHVRYNRKCLLLFFLQPKLIENIFVNDFEMKLSEEISGSPKERPGSSNRPRLIHDTGLCLGVPQSLFDTVVKIHKPLYIQVFKTALRITLIIFLLLVTMKITNATGTTSDLSDVMHVVFIVVMGALPHVLDMPHCDSTRKVKEDIFLKKIENTILQFSVKDDL